MLYISSDFIIHNSLRTQYSWNVLEYETVNFLTKFLRANNQVIIFAIGGDKIVRINCVVSISFSCMVSSCLVARGKQSTLWH